MPLRDTVIQGYRIHHDTCPVSPVSTGPLFPSPVACWRRQLTALVGGGPDKSPKHAGDMLKLARWQCEKTPTSPFFQANDYWSERSASPTLVVKMENCLHVYIFICLFGTCVFQNSALFVRDAILPHCLLVHVASHSCSRDETRKTNG